jgi:hypothetical protein
MHYCSPRALPLLPAPNLPRPLKMALEELQFLEQQIVKLAQVPQFQLSESGQHSDLRIFEDVLVEEAVRHFKRA